MKIGMRHLHRTLLLLLVSSASLALYAQTPSQTSPPSSVNATISQPSDNQNLQVHSTTASLTPTPTPNVEKGVMSPEMVTAIGDLWKWGVILIVCFVLFIFRRELRSLVKKAEQAETPQLGAPGVSLQIGKPLDTEKKIEPALSEEKATPPSQHKDVSEPIVALESESLSVEKTVEVLRDELEEAFSTNDESKIQLAYEALKVASTDPRDLVVNDAIYLYQKFRHGDTAAISKLQKLTEQMSASSVVYLFLGLCYEEAGELDKASDAYRHSVERTESKDTKAYRVIILANCLLKADKKSDAYKLVSEEISKTDESELLLILYKGLAELYKKSDNRLFQAFALEKALEHEPNNTDLIFDLAYAYSAVELHPLSILHYERLLHFESDNTSALNNVGVEYENQQMPILSVGSYKKASEFNKTLASANLAYRLMNAGFAEEALATLNNAKSQDDVHPNVGSALAALSEKQTAEREKREKLFNNATLEKQFFRAFAETYFRNINAEDENLEGAWKLEDGTHVQVTQAGSSVEANWTSIIKHQFTGVVTNRTLRLTKKKMEYHWYDKSEKGFEKQYEGYDYLSDNGQRLSIMYISASDPIFVMMTKNENGETKVTTPS